MKYTAERHQLLHVAEEMQRWKLLNPAGGAVSMRLPDGNILLSTAGSAFHRWNLGVKDFIALTPDGDIIDRTAGLGPSATTTHLAIYRRFPAARSCLHAHSPYSLAFASLGLPVPSVTGFTRTGGTPARLTPSPRTEKAGVGRTGMWEKSGPGGRWTTGGWSSGE